MKKNSGYFLTIFLMIWAICCSCSFYSCPTYTRCNDHGFTYYQFIPGSSGDWVRKEITYEQYKNCKKFSIPCYFDVKQNYVCRK